MPLKARENKIKRGFWPTFQVNGKSVSGNEKQTSDFPVKTASDWQCPTPPLRLTTRPLRSTLGTKEGQRHASVPTHSHCQNPERTSTKYKVDGTGLKPTPFWFERNGFTAVPVEEK